MRMNANRMDLPALITCRRARAATTALLKSFGASLAEIRQVHKPDCLLLEQVLGGVA